MGAPAPQASSCDLSSQSVARGGGGGSIGGMTVSLRPFQTAAVAEIRGALMSGHRAVLFVLPTGGGKTFTFVHIAEQAAIRGNRVCILVHRQELVDQASRSLHAIGCNHGIIAAGYRQDLRQGVQVASVQTLARRLHIIPPDFFQLLIVDEAHHAVAGTWAKVLAAMPRARVLGVTATPERLDGRGLGDQFSAMVQGPDAAWLTAEGFLVAARVFAPPGIDLTSVKRFDTRKGRHDADDILRQGQAMGDAVSHYRRTIEPHHNGTAIAFCCSVAHAEAVAEAFRAQGIPAATLDGSMDRGVRRRTIADLGAGVLKVLTSCDIISEGTDIPSVTGAILLRPTDSLGLHLQQVGRVLRPCPGKDHAVVNDHVGNTLRHGLPTDPRDWSLEGRPKGRGRKASDAIPIRICPACFSAIPSAANPCPECGHEVPVARRELVTVAGDLREMTGAELRRQERREVVRARTRDELEALARSRGYRPGWVAHMLAARSRGRTA
jgi:superfamily II DNA or RNA helicase